ncbi:hypothetical protein FBEOM_14228 [Fusarium beomiforme]|uniref:Protein NO VEIN C-terminal domain-containing protein n=1 Tax=Fusarium beomiforme TaxID=44412 RepID=A0A9P5A597_9HYPO|nr:hypothetical protein FBEOM_14228 [Fusarium beomiforme]
MANLEEAEKIVKEVTGFYGYLDHDMMDDIGRFNSDYRRRIDENWLKMENAASHSIKVLAKNIYGSGARFVFELLQNAEDNSFRKANRRNDPPFISFQIHPKHIVVECNEDGFTRSDLKAICSVGESTKTAAMSVPKASASNPSLSPRLECVFSQDISRSNSGTTETTPVLACPVTRTTLYLHDQGDDDEIQHLKTIISMQFDDLQETCLLFLRKLQKISVAFFDEDGNLERSKQFTKQKIDDYRVSLETTTVLDGEENIRSQIYHITKKLATGLAQSESRDPATTDEAQKILTSAEVVLAFPLENDYKPYISRKKQELFAFLPLRTSDYKDIVTTNRRNLNIRDWIAKAFLQAVLEFNEHPVLCYSWPLFLPSQEGGHDSFWSGLDTKIMSLIKDNPILRSRNRDGLRYINDVLIATNGMMDNNGELLLDNPIKDPFISTMYTSKATSQLKLYGLELAPVFLFVTLLKRDLKQNDSKMRADTTTDDWHSAVARMSSKICKKGWAGTGMLKSLRILPLRDSQWASSISGPVYFPMTADIEIPKGLDLKVLSASATTNVDRRDLFKHLGVTEATFETVRLAIFMSFINESDFTLTYILDCLRYLFLTHSNSTHKPRDYESTLLFTSGDKLLRTKDATIYLPGKDHPFSPGSLLEGGDVLPDFPVHFVDNGYRLGTLDHPRISVSTWQRWLCDYVGVQERLSALSPDGDELSQPFQYIFNHRPDKFLGLFAYLWPLEGKRLLKYPVLVSQIRQLSAKKLCGVRYSIKLEQTWLPFPQLKDSVQRYMKDPELFPFLILDSDRATEPMDSKWDFLSKHFGVGKNDDLDFLLDMLHCIERFGEDPVSIRQSQRVFELYIAIYAKLSVSPFDRESFNGKGILAPDQEDEEEAEWATYDDCLWNAPPDMDFWYPLKSLYKRRGLSDEDMSNIENLFCGTLGIRNVTVEDMVEELKWREGCDDDEGKDSQILNLYTYLHEEMTVTSDTRAAFEQFRLIFVRQQTGPRWYKASDCLWSSTTPIRGKVTLDETYEDLKALFVGKLGVKSLTMQMVYDELRQSPQSNVEDTKVALLSFNDFLQNENGHWDPEPIRKARIFPVLYPDGTVILSSIDVDFAIGDRDNLRSKFSDRISLLDFDLEDVHRLRPLFRWLRIQDRYLSKCVMESTAISSELQSPISSKKRDLGLKAYHICRVAATFRSPRFQHGERHLFEQLRAMRVLEVDRISSILKMSQNGELYRAELSTASEHIDETGGQLAIYVPRERRAQEICFGSVLPSKFAAWLMRNPDTNIDGNVEVDAVNALTSIFASDQAVLGDILDDQGIIGLHFEDPDEHMNEDEIATEQGEDEHLYDGTTEALNGFSDLVLTPTHSSVNNASLRQHSSPDSNSEGEDFETEDEVIERQSSIAHQVRRGDGRGSRPALHDSREGIHSSPRQSNNFRPIPSSPASQAMEDQRYRAILDRVVAAARRAAFPSGGAFDLNALRDALPDSGNPDSFLSFDGLDVFSRFRSTSQLERDKKIGAAGELYVFELLSKLELPGWGRGNWQSTIRTYANIHPDYADLSHWPNRETADIVYSDTEGTLTDILVDADILGDEWSAKHPKYYIEVKTTTGPCGTPFYMSGNQYRLMGRIHQSPDFSEIYIIFRIFFLLDSTQINYCVYPDPKKLEDDGNLLFTASTWSVTPGPQA